MGSKNSVLQPDASGLIQNLRNHLLFQIFIVACEISLRPKHLVQWADAKFHGTKLHVFNTVQFADSFNFNPHKWMMVNFDCSAMWMKNCYLVAEMFKCDATYLQHKHDEEVIDFRVRINYV